MKKNLLITLADENYLEYAKQVFAGAYFKAGWEGDYMLLSHNVSEEKLSWFSEKGIFIKRCESIETKILPSSKFSDVVLDKLYIFSEEFKKWETIIFVDVDTIIRYSLDPLKNKSGFRAVKEFFPYNPLLDFKRVLSEEENLLIEGFKKEYDKKALCHFNSGVMVLNTDIITPNLFKESLDLVKKYHTVFNFGEQPIINLLFYKKQKNLNFVYNFFQSRLRHYGLDLRQVDAAIIHAFDDHKPWQESNVFFDEWQNNYEKADFIDLTKKPPTAKRLGVFKELKINLFFVYLDGKIFIEKYMGLIGILIKKRSPECYTKLKKIMQYVSGK